MSDKLLDGCYAATMARIVLGDCREALRELEADPSGQTWRIRWVAVLALLRTVREVLIKVDGNGKPELKVETDKFWQRMGDTKPKPSIYWEFIRDDANSILHEYKFTAVQSVTSQPLGEGAPTTVSTSAQSSVTLRIEDRIVKRTYLMKAGPFKGRDQRKVVRQAIEWWEEQITEIESRAAAAKLAERL